MEIQRIASFGHVVRSKTVKIIPFATHPKHCAMCSSDERSGIGRKARDCLRKFDKSSKAVEAYTVVEVRASITTVDTDHASKQGKSFLNLFRQCI